MGREESRRGTARAGRRSAGDGALLGSLTLLEVETERREMAVLETSGEGGRDVPDSVCSSIGRTAMATRLQPRGELLLLPRSN